MSVAPPPPVTTREAARLLGVRPPTVRELLRRGELLGFEVGGRVKVNPESIVLYQLRHAVKAGPES
jgi:excisionase family DNA binding protein